MIYIKTIKFKSNHEQYRHDTHQVKVEIDNLLKGLAIPI